MDVGYAVLVINFIYVVIISLLFFTKKRVKNIETKIFSSLVISNILGLILEFLSGYFIKGLPNHKFLTLLDNSIYYLCYYYLFWI